jgi:alpha-ketoglutarate-dependent taurine dioxygenase
MSSLSQNITDIDNTTSPFALDNHQVYYDWRQRKLDNYPDESSKLIVEISDMANPTPVEQEKMSGILAKTNMVIYASRKIPQDNKAPRLAIAKLASHFGLNCAEAHRSAGEERMVALEVSNQGTKRGYIPYSTKPLNWHTDGYYNGQDEEIGTFILHCAQNALAGGQNQLLDPEIAYIRLRDKNPAYIEALSHPEAMTIPFNTEPDGTIRPDSVGPVFKALADNSAMTMRYTARTRSISWRDDAMTREAVAFLVHLMDNNEKHIHTLTMQPGQGLINNNVLHNRTGFENGGENGKSRLLYRIRFLQRIKQPATMN